MSEIKGTELKVETHRSEGELSELEEYKDGHSGECIMGSVVENDWRKC